MRLTTPTPTRAFVAVAAVLASVCAAATAQRIDPATLPAADALSDDAAIAVVTIGRGDDPHALFGHTALVVLDRGIDLSAAFNYGTFDFGEGFLVRFLHGDVDYSLSVEEGIRPLQEAEYFGRGFAIQWLALSPTQARELYRELRLEAQPARNTYRYRFIDHNCSTKVIDAMDRALGDAVRWPTGGPAGATEAQTFRDLLRGHLRDKPWYRFGIDTILGAPIDTPATPRQRAFLPVHLMELLEGTLVQSEGVARPIVAATRDGGLAPLPTQTTRRPVWVAIALLAAAGVGTLAARARPRAADWPMRLFDASLLLLTGVAGVVIAGMWAWSLHREIGPNGNVLWALPTNVVAAAWVLQRPGHRWLRAYLGVTGVVAIAAIPLMAALPQAFPPPAAYLAAAIGVRGVVRSGWVGSRRRAEADARETKHPLPEPA